MAQPGKNRARLQGAFVHALAEDFERHGKQALVDCRENNPAKYLAIIASLMPKELEISRPLDDFTDDQLNAALEAARALATAGGAVAGAGTGPASGPEPAAGVPAIPETI